MDVGGCVDLERLIVLIVKTVIDELIRQGVIPADRMSPAAPSQPHSTTTAGKRRVVTAAIVLDAAALGQRTVDVPAGSLITPLARDTAKDKGITIRVGGA